MSVPCAHCGKWTCACGQPAVALLALGGGSMGGGVLGRDYRRQDTRIAYCAACLGAMTQIYQDGIGALKSDLMWLTEEQHANI